MIRNGTGGVQAVDRALAILRLFARHDAELDLAEISNLAKLPKSTCHRLVATLEANGFVADGGGRGRYRLGLAAAQVGEVAMRQLRPSAAVRDLMEGLCSQTKETVGLIVLHGDRVLVIERVESPLPLRMQDTIGNLLPAHCTASGKLLLALTLKDDDEWLRRHNFQAFTANTITNIERFRSELERIRSNGYSVDNEEYCVGLFCMSVPVRNHFGDPVAALSISAPSARARPDRFPEFLELLSQCAAEISKQWLFAPQAPRPAKHLNRRTANRNAGSLGR